MFFLLSALVFANIDVQKESKWLSVENFSRTKTFVGYIEIHDDVLVLSHMPVGKYPNAVVYKHELMYKTADQKIVIEKAKNQDVAVKIAGQISSIGGKQYILIDAVTILNFDAK